MRKLLLFGAIIFGGLVSAQTSINDFMGEYVLQEDGAILKITPMSNNEGGTKARYDHGPNHFYHPDYPNPTQYNYVVIWDSAENTLTFEYIYLYIEYLDLTQYSSITFDITTFNDSEMVLTGEDGTVMSYQKTTMGVADAGSSLQQISIAQNPVKNDLILKLPNDLNAVSLKIINMEGKTVKNLEYKNGNKINVSELSSGIYILQIENNGNRVNVKMIKD